MRTDTPKTIAGVIQIVYTIDGFAEQRDRDIQEKRQN